MKQSFQLNTSLPEQWVERYLDFLNVDREPPGLVALRRLTRAHVRRVPFENSASLIRRASNLGRPVPPLDPNVILTSWIGGESGGVCFDLSSQFQRLLRTIGYDATPILARISFPGSHHAIVVRFDSDRYLLDIGCGSPLFEPIPLDRTTEWSYAGLSFRFRADDETRDCWRQDRWIGEKWEPFCQYELNPALEQRRYDAYQQHHEPGVSWVTGNLMMIRSDDENLFQLRDNQLTHYTESGKSTTQITSPSEIARIVNDVFGLPNYPLDEVLRSRDLINQPASS